MSRSHVVEIMGKPDSDNVYQNQETMTYFVDEKGGWGLAMMCAGAGFQGQVPPPECNRESRMERFMVRLTDGHVTAYGKIVGLVTQSSAGPAAGQGHSSSGSTPTTSGATDPDPNNKQFRCNNALRRYKTGVITYQQVERACQ